MEESTWPLNGPIALHRITKLPKNRKHNIQTTQLTNRSAHEQGRPHGAALLFFAKLHPSSDSAAFAFWAPLARRSFFSPSLWLRAFLASHDLREAQPAASLRRVRQNGPRRTRPQAFTAPAGRRGRANRKSATPRTRSRKRRTESWRCPRRQPRSRQTQTAPRSAQ